MSGGQNDDIFAQSAERLEHIARSLKSDQIVERQGHGALQVASSRLMAISPDEIWARQFSSQCIGPICFKMAPGSDMALPPLTQALQASPPVRQAAPAAYAPARVAAQPARPMPIGALIGKPVRRGFFGRIFGRA